jgi:hypothetical protein
MGGRANHVIPCPASIWEKGTSGVYEIPTTEHGFLYDHSILFQFGKTESRELLSDSSEDGLFVLQVTYKLVLPASFVNTAASVAQPFYTRGTLNIVEDSWRHTNHILHIVGGGGERWFMAFIGRDNFL